MVEKLRKQRGESAMHLRLKRLALIWAQANGYSACAVEVALPHCRYRADVAAYRPSPRSIGSTAIFECKQALPDLRRDNCRTCATRERLESVQRRRVILEKLLRVHYPRLRIPDSLFADFDSHDFGAIRHNGYTRVIRELAALQNRLFDCTKFEKLLRYRCANLFYLVLPNTLFRESEIPPGWGALVQCEDSLTLAREPVWHETTEQERLRFLERLAAAGTRRLNRQLEITFEEVAATRCRSCP
jgi:hypothetical protein